jgi:hypothetical protein
MADSVSAFLVGKFREAQLLFRRAAKSFCRIFIRRVKREKKGLHKIGRPEPLYWKKKRKGVDDPPTQPTGETTKNKENSRT